MHTRTHARARTHTHTHINPPLSPTHTGGAAHRRPTQTLAMPKIDLLKMKIKNGDRWSSVPSTPIDTLGMPRIDLLKIDAQGMEAEVLEGARYLAL